MTDEYILSEQEERKIFGNMIRHHDESYYDALFKPVIDQVPSYNWRADEETLNANPIRGKDGGSVPATYDNCINDPPPFPIDPDYADRNCVKGYYCNLSSRKWSCIHSIPKSPRKLGYVPK